MYYTKGHAKDCGINAFSAPVFTGKTTGQESQVPETSGEVWRKEDPPLMEEEHVMELLNKLDFHKSVGLEGIQP